MDKGKFDEKMPDFLIKMYEVYNNEIDRHFGLAWQAVSVFAASFLTILTTTEKINGIPSYIALSLYIALVAWGIETIVDAYFWYNRNLVVIANIERHFFSQQDAKTIHYYFLSHRPSNKPITFFSNLLLFLIVTPGLIIGFYFWIPLTHHNFLFYHALSNYIPFAVLLVSILQIRASAQKRNSQYREFIQQSPGLERGFPPLTSEHTFARAQGLSPISHALTYLQSAALSMLGIETR